MRSDARAILIVLPSLFVVMAAAAWVQPTPNRVPTCFHRSNGITVCTPPDLMKGPSPRYRHLVQPVAQRHPQCGDPEPNEDASPEDGEQSKPWDPDMLNPA
jgi:hypothetical protein